MAMSISTTHGTMRTAASDSNATVDRRSAAYSAMIQRSSPKTILRMRFFSKLSVGPLSGDKRTTFAQCAFFAFDPKR